MDFINPSELVREEDTRLILSVLNYIARLYKLSIILRAALGNPVSFFLTGGECADVNVAPQLLEGV